MPSIILGKGGVYQTGFSGSGSSADLVGCDADTAVISVLDGISSTVKKTFTVGGSNRRLLAWNSGDEVLYSADVNGDLEFLDLDSETVLQTLPKPSGKNGMMYNDSNDKIYYCDSDSKTITGADSETGILNESDVISIPDTASDLAYNPDNDTILSTYYDTNTIRELDFNGNEIQSFPSPTNGPYGITYDRSTGNIVTAHWEGNIYVHEGISATTTANFPPPTNFISALTLIY